VLEGRERREATTDWVKGTADRYTELVDEYTARGDAFRTPEQAAALLRALGQRGPENALDNGLDGAQNRELFETTDSYRIVELILTGMRQRWPGQGDGERA
jgi:hypothetical protein